MLVRVDDYSSPVLTPWSRAATPSSQHDPPRGIR
jgi:hypothetical protein